MVKIAGLDSNNEFEAESVKDHIKNLAASAVDVSGLAKKEDVASITQKIESGELKGDPGETVGVFGEADAALTDGTLTINPNHAVVNVPRISGAVTVKIEDVDLPEGVESANGVQVTLQMEGVDEGSIINWPVGTVTHDKSVPGKHVALLLRTDDHWEVYFPPMTHSAVDSDALFNEKYPVLEGSYYDKTEYRYIDGIVPIQVQISGSVQSGPTRTYFGKVDENGEADTIANVVERLWSRVGDISYAVSTSGKLVEEVEYRQYDEAENFAFPNPFGDHYASYNYTRRPSTIVKEIDGTPHLVHWMPKWSENMIKVLNGDMSYDEFREQAENSDKPRPPFGMDGPPAEEEIDEYNQKLRDWVSVYESSPIAWEAYTVPMTRDTSLDKNAVGFEILTDDDRGDTSSGGGGS